MKTSQKNGAQFFMNCNDKLGKVPGLHVQWPWSRLLISGKKRIETRNYALPTHYLNKPLAVIETPGSEKKDGRPTRSRIIGIVVFGNYFEYKSFSDWRRDYERHLVPIGDNHYSFKTGQRKWGWVVSKVVELDLPVSPPERRGIIFVSNCSVPSALLNF